MLFNKTKYEKISLENYPIIMEYFEQPNIKLEYVCSDGYPICAFTYLEGMYFIEDGYLFILNKTSELLFIPFNLDGEFIPFAKLVGIMKREKIMNIICVPDNAIKFFGKDMKQFFKTHVSKAFGNEYTYDNVSLMELQGKEFKNLRNKVHKFWNRYGNDINISLYESDMYNDAIDAYNTWLDELGSKILSRGEKIWDKQFYEFCLKNYEKLGIDFYLVYDTSVDKCIGCVAYVIMNEQYAYGLFRKLSSRYNYIAQYMQYYQAKMLCEQEIRYLNDAYDGNEQGLRDLKTGFKPILITTMNTLTIK